MAHSILLLPTLSQLPIPYGEFEASTIATAFDPHDTQVIHLALRLVDASYGNFLFRMVLRRDDSFKTEQGLRTFGSVLDDDLIGSKLVVKVWRPSRSLTVDTGEPSIPPSRPCATPSAPRSFEDGMRRLSAIRKRLTKHDASASGPSKNTASVAEANSQHPDDIEVDPDETGTPPPHAIRAYTEHGLAEMSDMPVERIRSAFEFLRSRGTTVQRINGDFCVASSPGIEALCLAFRMFMLMNKCGAQPSSEPAPDWSGSKPSA